MPKRRPASSTATAPMPAPVETTHDDDDLPIEQILALIPAGWRSQPAQGMALRHEAGRVINRHLGPPTRRQRYGRRVMQRLEDLLRLSAEELGYMRQFAARFSRIEDFVAEYPERRSWLQVKELLRELRRRERGEPGAEDDADPAVHAAFRRIQAATRAVGQVRFSALRAEDGERFFSLLKDLAGEVGYLTRLDLQLANHGLEVGDRSDV